MPGTDTAARGSGAHRSRLAVFVIAVGLALALVPSANAAPSAKASLVTTASVIRVQVTLNGVTRPSVVRATVAGRVYRLVKVGAKWRSGPLSTIAVTNARKLNGKTILVRVTSAGKVITLRPKLVAPTPPPPALTPPTTTPPPAPPVTPGAPSLFTPPSQNLTGAAALPFLQTYFVNSRFTDCPAGWPNCAVEEKYDHCTDGSWSYFRLTPSSGSDINSQGSFQVTGAEVKTDGSWGVEYLAQLGTSTSISFYSWRVSPTGQITGYYWPPGTHPSTGHPPSQQLVGLLWQRPTNCGQKF